MTTPAIPEALTPVIYNGERFALLPGAQVKAVPSPGSSSGGP